MFATAKWIFALSVVLGSWVMAWAKDGAAIDPVWLAKARSKIETSYEKRKALSLRLEEECVYRSEKAPGAPGKIPFRPHTNRMRIVRLEDNAILQQIRVMDEAPNRPQIRLQCDNSDYNFTVG